MSKMEELSFKLKLWEGKRAAYFARIQTIHDSMTRLTDESSHNAFIAQAETVDQIRNEIMIAIDNINMISMQLNPKYEVNYQSLSAFDDLYCKIKHTLSTMITIKTKSSNSKSGSWSTKLPRIELPNFDGDIQNFPFFYETFKRVIHDNPDLTDSERIHYLLGHLTGKAKGIAAGIVPAAENYRVVWDALVAKYKDTRALAVNYLNQLFALRSAGSSPANIEKVFDKFTAIVAGLKQLKIDDLSDFIFIYVGLKLLDSDTAKNYEMSLRNTKDLQDTDYGYFVSFIREHVKIIYRTSQQRFDKSTAGGNSSRAPTSATQRVSQVYVTTSPKCSLCQGTHTHLFKCNAFIKLPVPERFKFMKENHFCGNCLSGQHTVSQCKSSSSCKKCQGKHHSLLHFNQSLPPHQTLPSTSAVSSEAVPEETVQRPSGQDRVSLCTLSATAPKATRTTELLATAKVLVVGKRGKDVIVRCLLDPGSQKNYITTRCCRKLGLPIHEESAVTVKGIGGTEQPVRGSVSLTFSSRLRARPKYNIDALVLDEITGQLPLCPIDVSILENIDKNLLADDTWGIPGTIDILLGVNLFARLLQPNKYLSATGCPDALETVLGYVLLGDAPVQRPVTTSLSFCAVSSLENYDLRKFWEIEEVQAPSVISVDDKYCEEFYTSTTTRTSQGRYVVALPLKADASTLGNSLDIAKRRFNSLERKLNLHPKVKLLYDEVIRDYLHNNYISLVTEINPGDISYYIPHHAVIREDKATTKLRVVLDASAKTDNGISLNDILHAGPALQADLFNILINLRLHAIAITADVRHMYLRIEVRPEDRCLQRILYRFNPDEPLQVYQFNRVPFGLKSSPFLAIRTVQQLCIDEPNLTLANEILSRDIFMDDIASSIPTPSLAIDAAHQLIQLFGAADFQLAKWTSNSSEVLAAIPESLRLSLSVDLSMDSTLKILGLRWFPADDYFAFHVNPDDRPCTKRNILSSIARLFDALGLVAPMILYAKLLIKELWLQHIDWDEVPPSHIVRLWEQFKTELPQISNLKFTRHIGVVDNCKVKIVGFADASEKAYGGVIYTHVTRPNGDISVTLVCAKSKVAPLKVVSLARLELCAALLLSTLIKRVFDLYSARYPIEDVVAFSDSTVTLSWIHSSPHRWHTYVANRIARIHENLSPDHFFHVKGSENPSDCLSRGLSPAQLLNNSLWLHGPSWLGLPTSEWPVKPFVSNDSKEIPEMKSVALPVVATNSLINDGTSDILYVLSQKFSSWMKYLRAICFVLKFATRLARGPITASDLDYAEMTVWRSIQKIYFESDLERLSKNQLCSNAIQKLSPFLHDGIIRVGGRLKNSELDFDSRHQILLPRLDHIVEILVNHYHITNFHTGPNLLHSLLRQRYWILSARRIIRHVTFKCNICFRAKPRSVFPIMANLPQSRVETAPKAFYHTGCDYAGPIMVTPSRGRGVKSRKAYICLFTCLTTRALHLELAFDLSTASFLASLKRFISRRGPIQTLYTDNATNFVGARSHLRDLYKFLSNEYRQDWENELTEQKINWKFIPPSAPHFGGCWESSIKCVKTHIFKVIGQQILTYDELNTVLTQVEALLNSRPLYALSSDPSDPTALTPAHFLYGKPLNFLPSREVTETRLHLISRHELTDKMVQSFWKRWRNEYLHTLQTRQKWNTPANPVRKGMVVVSMQDNVQPLHWPLGLIVEVFPDRSGVIRVATIKTKYGIFQRPVVKLCPLPTQ